VSGLTRLGQPSLTHPLTHSQSVSQPVSLTARSLTHSLTHCRSPLSLGGWLVAAVSRTGTLARVGWPSLPTNDGRTGLSSLHDDATTNLCCLHAVGAAVLCRTTTRRRGTRPSVGKSEPMQRNATRTTGTFGGPRSDDGRRSADDDDRVECVGCCDGRCRTYTNKDTQLRYLQGRLIVNVESYHCSKSTLELGTPISEMYVLFVLRCAFSRGFVLRWLCVRPRLSGGVSESQNLAINP